MQNIIKNLVVVTLALATLTLSAVAQPQAKEDRPSPVEKPATTVIVETLQQREASQQPLVTQEDVDQESVKELQERPRGESRSERDKASRSFEKPLLEVHGF